MKNYYKLILLGLFISSPLIFSPLSYGVSGIVFIHGTGNQTDKIQLINLDNKSSANKSSSNIHSLADPQALATAGLTDDSSALIMSSSAKPGKYQLEVSAPLAAKSSYLVNVKEKHSDASYQTLKLVSNHGQWQAQLPETLAMPSSNQGLSEIQINGLGA